MNKPVAWITPDNLKILENEYGEEVLVRNQDHYTYEIPLYTTPQTKPLSDEEIIGLWVKKNNLNGASDIIEFAREIRGEK